MATIPITLQRSRTTDGTAYHRSGRGRPVVLVHGVGLRAESWYRQIAVLEKTHTVFAIDMTGHGESRAIDDGRPGLAPFTEQLGTFVDKVVAEPAVVVGHSMGASVVLDFAARHPAMCRGVAALTAIYRRAPDARAAVQARAATLEAGTAAEPSAPIARWFGEAPSGADRDLAELCRRWLMQGDTRGYASAYSVFAAEDGPADAQLAALEIPALFLTGEEDRNSTPAMSERMARLARYGDTVIVSNARHMVQLTHPESVNAALGSFLDLCANPATVSDRGVTAR